VLCADLEGQSPLRAQDREPGAQVVVRVVHVGGFASEAVEFDDVEHSAPQRRLVLGVHVVATEIEPEPTTQTIDRDLEGLAPQVLSDEEATAQRMGAELGDPNALARGRHVADFDLSPWLGKIASPTLVVHAAADAVMPEERVRALASAIPGAELRVHPRSGHGLVFEDPGWLVGVYRDFLDRHAGAAGGGG